MIKNFGYIPDFKEKSQLKDLFLKIIGYPYAPRRNEARIVINLLDPKKGEKILDLGCGDGVWYLYLQDKGYNVVGIDISNLDLLKLKTRAKMINLTANIICCDGQNMCLKSSSLDKIFSICVLEHIPNDDNVLLECNRILRTNGSLTISVAGYNFSFLIKLMVGMPKIIKKIFGTSLVKQSNDMIEFRNNFDNKFNHYRNYEIESFRNKLMGFGFDILKIEYNAKIFGSFASGIIHSFKFFEWDKNVDKDYSFRNVAFLVLLFPFFYFLFRLDDILLNKKGINIIIHAKKIRPGKNK